MTAAAADAGEPPMSRPEAIEHAVSRKFKELRQLAGLSQTGVAERMFSKGQPWHQSTVYKIETGRRPIRVGELADLAAVLGVTQWVLLSDDHYREASAVREAMERVLREQIAAEIVSGAHEEAGAA